MTDSVLLSWHFCHKYLTLPVALAVIVLTLVFGSLPNINLFWQELQNTGHTLLFIPVAILILLLLQNTTDFFRHEPFQLYLASASISLLIGVFIELIQLVLHRDASTMDVARDFAGIITGLGLYATVDPMLQLQKLRRRKRVKTGIIMLSFFIFFTGLLPLVFLSAAYAQREIALPLVVDLSTDWVQPFLQLKNASIRLADSEENQAFKEDRLTRIELKNGIYSGFSIIETFPDWSAYQALKVVIYSTFDQPFKLVLRIHDAHHNYAYTDRFNMELTVNKGENHFHIPLEDVKNAPASREMNMTYIKDITFFSARPAEGMYFYVGDMRLE